MLKPLIKQVPTIIHGTKDLALRFNKISIKSHRSWYIITGDVVAFYTNVPLEPCLEIVEKQYSDYYFKDKARVYEKEYKDYLHNERLKVFKDALHIGHTDLLLQFDGKIYRQNKGLAMGVAASPDLANLYGWFFEQKSDIHNDPLIPFYGRYIDDCLAIVYAESLEEAILQVSSRVSYDGCEIKWTGSDKYQVFLDMVVYKDADGSLQTMPYRKLQSHQERIPWISHHPIDVKKGTFIGEMSQMAVLSSKFATYQEAVESLVALYIRRGYPSDLVKKWRKLNLLARWEKRLVIKDDKAESIPVLVLKSYFNPAWNYFNARELQDNIFGYWREWVERAKRGNFNLEFPRPPVSDSSPLFGSTAPLKWVSYAVDDKGVMSMVPDITKTDILDRRVLVSRKRTKNLFDASNLWKYTVLSRLEEGIIEDLTTELGLKSLETERPIPAMPGLSEDIMRETARHPTGAPLVFDTEGSINLHRRSPSPQIGKGWY
ncbi:hypothetical protein EW145_g7645 [Phellinidium pouzarii]|uniref:Reverse transcriptase domain-containing protein n=1 Tax=Phellinidium pouzarii TaxID=167371 RepID=A0A4S4KHG5_9AGAM|nr:hypothetical protein EW145_g7645 [Phellinidium pouzarii]